MWLMRRRLDGWRPSRWLALGLGFAAIAAGAALTLKPFSSLDALTAFIAASLVLTGLGEIATGRTDPNPWPARIVGTALLVTGVIALLLPDATVRLVAVAVGIGLAIGGLSRLAAGLRRDADDRYASVVGGLAGLVFGVLALAWRDVTILVVALLVGPVAVVFGVGQVVRAVTNRLVPPSDSVVHEARRPVFRRRGLRVVRVTGSLILALALVGVSAWLHRGSPTVDAFYDTPDDLPAEPGRLLRTEGFSRAIPAGATAERILFTTTAIDGSIGVASALVVVPAREPTGPWPVLLWAHGTTGVARPCAPTLLPDPLGSGAMPAQQEAIDNGWVLVAPDYIGLGTPGPHPYLIGVPTARSSLDAVRAARQIDGLSLGDDTVVWGHSQGGGAALWVGIEAGSYAPDVPLAGVVALAPASDLLGLASVMQDSPIGMLFGAYVVDAYSRVYPDVSFDDYVRASARKVVREVVARCISEPAFLVSVGAVLTGEQVFSRDLTSGALGSRAAENIPNAPSGVPTFIGQGASDQLVHADQQHRFVDGLCAAGQAVDYRTYAGRDHLSVVADDSPLIPDLLAWTQDRFAEQPPAAGCSTTER
jgi:alpha-beta hydrolase superfamily lysophospholipase